MENRLIELAKQTGAKEEEIKRLYGGGFIAVCVAALAMLFSAGCADSKAKSRTVSDQISNNSQDKPQSAAGENKPVKKKSPNDGPWQGYPTGMKYAAVSPLDFPAA